MERWSFRQAALAKRTSVANSHGSKMILKMISVLNRKRSASQVLGQHLHLQNPKTVTLHSLQGDDTGLRRRGDPVCGVLRTR